MSKSQALKGSRLVALELLEDVEFEQAYANLSLPRLIEAANLDSRDAAFAQELAFGTIRWQLFYDRIIEIAAKRSVEEIDLKALLLLRLGAHQLLGMRVPSHAALSETVQLSKIRVGQGTVGFINGVLRRISERSREEWLEATIPASSDRFERLSIEHSHPVWIIKALQQSLELDGKGDELEYLLASDNRPAPVSLVALPGIANSDDFFGLQLGPASPVGAELETGNPNDIAAFRAGRIRVQDQGSQLAALALVDAKPISPGEKWLDMCAGPGGKAALLAAEARLADSTLLCNEVAPHRAKLVTQALAVIPNPPQVRIGDGRDFGSLNSAEFDRILLDAPCTGLGALRRRPEARWRKQKSDLIELTKLQRELLESAFSALKPGGVLAYVTCSPHPSETTAQIETLLKAHGPQITLLDANAVLQSLNPDLNLNLTRRTAQLWPHSNGTDAMFVALLQKVG